MKNIILIATIFLLSITGAIASEPTTINIRLGQEKTVALGTVRVKFLSVVEDSRCPMNARCIWAGNAKIRVAVTVGRRPAKIVELNSNTAPQTVDVSGYRLSLQDLKPQKGQPADWPKKPITATVSVEKSAEARTK